LLLWIVEFRYARAGGRSHAFLKLRVVLPIKPQIQHEVPPARRKGAFTDVDTV
jgi:hypothetical protein